MPYQNQLSNTGSYVESSSVLDVARLYEVDVNSEEFKDLIVKLFQVVNNAQITLNTKESALYFTKEFVDGSVWFNPLTTNQLYNRSGFVMVVNIGAIANAATATKAHGIEFTSTYSTTQIYGSGTDNIGFNYFPIPYIGFGGSNITIDVNQTNVVVTNNSGVNLTSCIAVIKYLKN